MLNPARMEAYQCSEAPDGTLRIDGWINLKSSSSSSSATPTTASPSGNKQPFPPGGGTSEDTKPDSAFAQYPIVPMDSKPPLAEMIGLRVPRKK